MHSYFLIIFHKFFEVVFKYESIKTYKDWEPKICFPSAGVVYNLCRLL
jgi:hypothetical protein